jgi:ankyrin repeat domain-containing protein 17
VVKTLLACGADHGAFVVDSTPLHMAALGGATDVVDALMEAGADADARAPNGYTTPLEAAARYAADIILDRRDEREARAYRRSVAGYVDDARRRGDDAARAAALDVLDAYDDYDPYGDDSDDDSFDDGALDELAGGEYDDDDEGWYDDETGDAFASGTGGARGSRRFGSSSRGSSALRGNRRALGSKPKRSSRGGYDRASRERGSSDSDSDSYYDGSRGDDDAAMAALRDAEGPLRAARHLVQRWSAEVTPHALVGACRAGDEATAMALLDAAEKNHAKDSTRYVSPSALVKSVARNTTALHAAAESGCVVIARSLCDRGAEVEKRRPDDDATPLFVAARHGRSAMIAFLYSVGADIEALCKTADRREGHDTVTPLVEAVMSDQAAAAARLIALGADVRAPDSWMPPLLTATLRSNATITRMLLREGADPRVGVGGMTPLGLAVMTRQSDLVHALLDWRGDDELSAESDDESSAKKPRRGTDDVSSETERKRARDNSRDATENANEKTENVSTLTLENLADPDEDPAVIAAARARLDAATAARTARADGGSDGARRFPERSGRRNVTGFRVDPDEPIDAAVLDDGDPEMSGACQCPVCQRRGRDGDGALDDKGFCAPAGEKLSGAGAGPYGAERHLTPLAAAAKLDDAETVRALLAAGANPERASGGMPPLAHAAGKGSCAAIVALLEGGAQLESAASLPLTPRDGRTLTPLGVASEAGELAAVELLLRRGADPNGPPGRGFEPPLCCAVTDPPDDEEGNPVVGVVRALIRAGADPNASKEDAQSPYSPLMVAAGAGSVGGRARAPRRRRRPRARRARHRRRQRRSLEEVPIASATSPRCCTPRTATSSTRFGFCCFRARS